MIAPVSRLRARDRSLKYGKGLFRMELSRPADGFERQPSTGAVSPMVKAQDPETERLIAEALKKREGRS